MKPIRHILLSLAALACVLPTSAQTARKTKTCTASDMVLIYAGGARNRNWSVDRMKDYVSYTDRDGKAHWLFDGFLLLEIRDIGPGSAEVAFDPGHKNEDGSILPAATQADWLKLIDYYFSEGQVTGSETFRRDKLLAVIDSSEKRARRVIRKTARMATHLNAAFTVLYVQGDREADDRIPLARQRYLINNLNLATELGGEVRRIRSNSPVESIAGVCREQKINIVCIGRPEFSLFSLLKSAIRLRRLTVRLSRMNIDLFIFS